MIEEDGMCPDAPAPPGWLEESDPTESIRSGCCDRWPKPCSYHEGWLDGWQACLDIHGVDELAGK